MIFFASKQARILDRKKNPSLQSLPNIIIKLIK